MSDLHQKPYSNLLSCQIYFYLRPNIFIGNKAHILKVNWFTVIIYDIICLTQWLMVALELEVVTFILFASYNLEIYTNSLSR